MRMYFLGKYQLHVNQSPCMLQRCSGGLQGLKLFYMRLCEIPVSEADKIDDTGERRKDPGVEIYGGGGGGYATPKKGLDHRGKGG